MFLKQQVNSLRSVFSLDRFPSLVSCRNDKGITIKPSSDLKLVYFHIIEVSWCTVTWTSGLLQKLHQTGQRIHGMEISTLRLLSIIEYSDRKESFIRMSY